MTGSGTMLGSGINNVAAALVFRKVASLGIEVDIKISGEGMNHTVEIALPDGRRWTIHNAREWFELYPILRRGTASGV